MNWWNELTSLQQIFAAIAIPATMVMIIQFVLFIFGLGQDGDAGGFDLQGEVHAGDVPQDWSTHEVVSGSDFYEDVTDSPADHQAPQAKEPMDALHLFSLRSIIAFFAIGGWMGLAAISWQLPIPLSCVMAFFAGCMALYFVAWTARAALRLQQSGNVEINNAIGLVGEVYIPIPASKSGVGKITLLVQERLCEFEAMTANHRTLKTGESVTVMGVKDQSILLVVPNDQAETY